MQTLSYGYLKPQNPNTGDLFFPAMEANIQRMNDHTHNGVDGARIALSTQSILAAAWAAVPLKTGLYEQTVTLPVGTGLLYDSCQISFRLSTGECVYPSVTRVSNTQYKIRTNDNTLAYVAYYR